MARNHARLLSSIWRDTDFRALTARQQRLYMLLISQPDLSTCGVLAFNPKRWAAMASDTDADGIAADAEVLNTRTFVVIDYETDELAVRTFLRNDGILSQPNILKSSARTFDAIHSARLREIVVAQLPPAVQAIWPSGVLTTHPRTLGQLLREPFPEPFVEPFADSFPPPDPSPSSSVEALELPLGREEEEEHYDQRVGSAIELEVDRREAARTGRPLINRGHWRSKVRADVLADVGPNLEAEAVLDTAASPQELLTRVLAPPPVPNTAPRPDCDMCANSRWVELRERRGMYPCPSCRVGEWPDREQLADALERVLSG